MGVIVAVNKVFDGLRKAFVQFGFKPLHRLSVHGSVVMPLAIDFPLICVISCTGGVGACVCVYGQGVSPTSSIKTKPNSTWSIAASVRCSLFKNTQAAVMTPHIPQPPLSIDNHLAYAGTLGR